MTRECRRRFALQSAKKTTRYVTRDGRRVIRWRLIHDPEHSLWPVEVTVEVPHSRGRIKYIVNQNGRRYANVRSADDIYEVSRERLDPWPYDCMPNPIEAIGYVRTKQYGMIKIANKLSSGDVYSRCDRAMITNMEIGSV